MKIRNGFVSNSSSSSFCISLKNITGEQLQKILNFDSECEKLDLDFCNDHYWSVWTDIKNVYGETIMDNFDMHSFLDAIGINDDLITWGE
jgi:hypothetical protein